MSGDDLVMIMTFMYFTVAHQGDGEITDDEMKKARDFTLRYSGNFPNFEYNFPDETMSNSNLRMPITIILSFRHIECKYMD